MKKIYSLVVALFATMALSAQTYDFSTMNFTQDDITVVNGEITDNAEKSYFEVKNNEGETVEMTFQQVPNVVFSYKNSAVKTAFKVYYGEGNGKVQLDGNQRDITFNNITPGTDITLTVASKGSTAAQFVESSKGTPFTGCVHKEGAVELAPKGDEMIFTDLTVTAIASTVTIRETSGGYVISKIVIGNETGLNNATVESAKAQKVIENGVLYILKNGVKYNVLGAVVK